jgi:HD-GYP domain-containing protein (c-di-GMP phosphodiesterase class II)
MFFPRLIRPLYWTAKATLLVATVAAAVSIYRPEEWHPPILVVLLLAFALAGRWFSVETGSGILSASLVAIVLAIGLLGPTPAMACGIAAMIPICLRRRLPPAFWIGNLMAFAVVPFLGGLMMRALVGYVESAVSRDVTQSVVFGLDLLAVFVVALGANFILIGLDETVEQGRSLRRQIPEFLPLLPGELAAGMLATILAVAYRSAGLPVLVAAIALLLIFQHLTVALVRSEDRAEQLQARSRQLVGLQLGVLRTLVRALEMRDKTTGHHAAAVARSAKALAIELACSEEERDVLHASGLLHEIGKFTWPDRVLHAKNIPNEDLAIVRNHPQEGAILVGALDGYGPVADAILYHHERVDGRGYPAGLIGSEIPLASRILAICCTYHTMIAGEGYRSPMTVEEAVDELRNASRNGQLDAELVERFIVVLEREGPTLDEDADFDTELEFERRVGEMAQPHAAEPSSQLEAPTGSQTESRWRFGLSSLRQRT